MFPDTGLSIHNLSDMSFLCSGLVIVYKILNKEFRIFVGMDVGTYLIPSDDPVYIVEIPGIGYDHVASAGGGDHEICGGAEHPCPAL